MARIFISYARKDAAQIADELADQLRVREHEVFLDVQSIRAGARWRLELNKRIKWSDLIIVLVTPGSNESDFVYQEVSEAERRGKIIIPVQVGDTPLPVHLRGTWQAITFKTNNFDAILLEIQSALFHLPRSRTIFLLMMSAGIVIAIIVVLGIVLLQRIGNLGGNGGTPEAEIGIDLTGNTVTGTTPTPTNILTNTPFPPTVVPTVTLTHTPRPTSIPISTVTPISAGTVLLNEDFEDNSMTNMIISYREGKWQIVDEDGNKILDIQTGTSYAQLYFGSTDWSNYSIDYRVKFLDWTGDYPVVAVGFRKIDSTSYIQSITPFYKVVEVDITRNSSAWQGIFGTAYVTPRDKWIQVHIEAFNERITVSIDGKGMIDTSHRELVKGSLSLGVSPNAHIQFDEIRITYLGK